MKTFIKTFINKLSNNSWRALFISFIGILILWGCEGDFLNKAPLDQLSNETFWKNEDDATLALIGCYNTWCQPMGSRGFGLERLDTWSDNALDKNLLSDPNYLSGVGNLVSTNNIVASKWREYYQTITTCNQFLSNINDVDMDETVKDVMIAEVRFIRAVQYFWLSHYWETGFPLIKKVLTLEEANNAKPVESKEEVTNFILAELTEAAMDLPETQSSQEQGRATKAAALAFKGRLLMALKQWSQATETYKTIIDMGLYEIDPRYTELFIIEGENSPEHIFCYQFIAATSVDQDYQLLRPWVCLGGYHDVCPELDMLEAYECIDGQTIDESPLYDPDNPYVDGTGIPYRDPRLYATIILPGSTIMGNKYISHPDSVQSDDHIGHVNATGFCLRKFIDESYEGDPWSYGGDIPLIRYAEVLLSYLESKLEAGDNITQTLLDQTINLVRGRDAVDMPPVTELNPDDLRTILRRERRVELAFEGLRYWDLKRWNIAHEKLSGDVYGMVVCDDPGSCGFKVDEEGHYYVVTRNFKEHYYKWPIPQPELDINLNLTQHPGY